MVSAGTLGRIVHMASTNWPVVRRGWPTTSASAKIDMFASQQGQFDHIGHAADFAVTVFDAFGKPTEFGANAARLVKRLTCPRHIFRATADQPQFEDAQHKIAAGVEMVFQLGCDRGNPPVEQIALRLVQGKACQLFGQGQGRGIATDGVKADGRPKHRRVVLFNANRQARGLRLPAADSVVAFGKIETLGMAHCDLEQPVDHTTGRVVETFIDGYQPTTGQPPTACRAVPN